MRGPGTFEPFRWTQATGMVGLGHLPEGSFSGSSAATAVSADGSVVVGFSHTPEWREAFYWTEENGMVGIGGPSAEEAKAIAVSEDGSVVLGWAQLSSGGSEPFRWTEEEGAVSLGALPGESHSNAFDLSEDGSVAIGLSGMSPFYWTETSGIQDLRDILRDGGVDLTEWWLEVPLALSADGLTVLGYGTHKGEYVGWMATIPEPATLLLLGLGGLMLRKRRRKQG